MLRTRRIAIRFLDYLLRPAVIADITNAVSYRTRI